MTTSRLSTSTIQQLTPLLGSLARIVATGSRLSEHELNLLLLGADLEAEPMVLGELKRWGKILRAFKEQPSVDLRRATVEALSLRDLPEAPVLLAVDIVARSAPAVTSKVTPEANQPTVGASIVVDPGSLESAVREAPAGAVLRLRAGEHRLSCPLEIDKSLSLIGEGRDETRVLSDNGSYAVKFVDGDQLLVIPTHVAEFVGDGPFVVHDLSFEYQGSRWAHVVEVGGGEIDIRRCCFIGGVGGFWDEEGKRGGSGLRLGGRTRGLVADCEALRNGLDGISIADQAQPTLEANTCQENKWSGISYSGNSSGTARQNTCSGNGGLIGRLGSGIFISGWAQPTLQANSCQQSMYGIHINGQAQPTLESNTCRENESTGISYSDSATGTARHNVCSANEYDGISIGDQAQPTLENNTCQENKRCGIYYSGSAAGTARDNVCSGNEEHGIIVFEQAQPILEANICLENTRDGIDVWSDARPILKDNRC